MPFGTHSKDSPAGFWKSYGVFTIFSIILGLLIFILVSGTFFFHRMGHTALLAVITLMIALFLGLGIALSHMLVKKLRQMQADTEELRKFKDFIFHLHTAATEIEVYGILHDYMRRLPNIQHTTVFFRTDTAPEEGGWRKISNDTVSICDLPLEEECPAARHIHGPCACRNRIVREGSCVCLPILYSGYIQSILQLCSKEGNIFSAQEIDRMKAYLEITVPVLQSKRALHLLNKKATTDKLTKVYNRDFLEPYLENQMEAANLSNQQLSLIMLDIDYFKTVNDTWGHAAGDAVLVLFTEVTLKCIRKSDLMARYGGDEFLVVLPATDLKTARTIAERIRQTMDETRVPPLDGVPVSSVTCSLGLACYPLHCSSVDELIKCCDKALYKAKKSGRNKVVVYQQE